MNHPCEIIRDLIPLCLDQTASNASRDAVKTHLQGCPDCAAVYAGMSLALPGTARDTSSPEEVSQTIRTLHRKKRSRTLRATLLILVTALLLTGATILGLRALDRPRAPLSPDEVTVTLSQFSPTGTYPIVMTADTASPQDAVIPVLTHAQERGFDIVYLQLYLPSQDTSSILAATRHTMDLDSLIMDDVGNMLLESSGEDGVSIRTPVTEVRLGTPSHFQVLYRAGTSLPEASSSYRVYARAGRELSVALSHLGPDAMCDDLDSYPSLSDHDAHWEQLCYMLTERRTHMRQIAPEFIAP